MTKDYLKEHIDKLAEADQLKDELDSLYIMLKSPVITGMPGGHSADADKIGNVVAKIQEKEARYLGKLNVILDEEKVIEEAIDKLKDPRERTVMRYRYISGLKWEEICVKAHYSRKHIHRIHSNALKNIQYVKDDIE